MSTQLWQTTMTDPRWPTAQADAVQAGWTQAAPVFAWAEAAPFQSVFFYLLTQLDWMQDGLSQRETYAPPVYIFGQVDAIQGDMIQAQSPAGWPPPSAWIQAAYKRAPRPFVQKGMVGWSFIQGE